jgi:hypothetical protein
MKMKLVLDIDHTLAEPIASYNLEGYLRNNITQESIIFAKGKPHYLYHGALEFIRYLHDISTFPLTYYSAGDPERNSEFATELMSRALGRTQANIRPFKPCDQLIDSKMNREMQANIENGAGHRKKDLSLSISEHPELVLSDVIFIDDDPSYVLKGQETNLLKVLEHHAHIDAIGVELDYRNPDVFYSLNRIFYITGVLSLAINNARKDNLPITEALAKLQLDQTNSPWTYKDNLRKTENFYNIGLNVLRQYNVNLKFLEEKHRPRSWTNLALNNQINTALIQEQKLAATTTMQLWYRRVRDENRVLGMIDKDSNLAKNIRLRKK